MKYILHNIFVQPTGMDLAWLFYDLFNRNNNVPHKTNFINKFKKKNSIFVYILTSLINTCLSFVSQSIYVFYKSFRSTPIKGYYNDCVKNPGIEMD